MDYTQKSSRNCVLQSQFTIKNCVGNIISSIIIDIIMAVVFVLLSWVPIVNLFLGLAVFLCGISVLFNIIFCIVVAATHKNAYFCAEGVYVGRSISDSEFVSWDKISCVQAVVANRKVKIGKIHIVTKYPHEKKPDKSKIYIITEIRTPCDIANSAEKIRKDYLNYCEAPEAKQDASYESKATAKVEPAVSADTSAAEGIKVNGESRKPKKDILEYALKFTTDEGMKGYLKYCSGYPELEALADLPDAEVRSAVKNLLRNL